MLISFIVTSIEEGKAVIGFRSVLVIRGKVKCCNSQYMMKNSLYQKLMGLQSASEMPKRIVSLPFVIPAR